MCPESINEFRDNMSSDSHTLLKGVHGFLSVLAVFHGRFSWNYVQRIFIECRSGIISLA